MCGVQGKAARGSLGSLAANNNYGASGQFEKAPQPQLLAAANDYGAQVSRVSRGSQRSTRVGEPFEGDSAQRTWPSTATYVFPTLEVTARPSPFLITNGTDDSDSYDGASEVDARRRSTRPLLVNVKGGLHAIRPGWYGKPIVSGGRGIRVGVHGGEPLRANNTGERTAPESYHSINSYDDTHHRAANAVTPRGNAGQNGTDTPTQTRRVLERPFLPVPQLCVNHHIVGYFLCRTCRTPTIV